MEQVFLGLLDEMGYIALPPEAQRAVGWSSGMTLELCVNIQAQEIVLKPPGTACICCGEPDAPVCFQGRHLCRRCVKELRAL